MEPTILSAVFAGAINSYKLYKDLTNNSILTYPKTTIDWTNGSIEQQWKLANKRSKLNYVAKLIDKKIEIPKASKEKGLTIPTQKESLFQLGILSKSNNMLIIHLKKIAGMDDSQAIIIWFNAPFDTKTLYMSMVERNSKLLPRFVKPGASVYSFSVMLDLAHTWKDDFESVRFVSIILEYDIPIDKQIVEMALPVSLKENLESKANQALRRSSDALQFMNTLNSNIRRLQDQELKETLDSISYVDSHYSDVKIHSVTCKVNLLNIIEGQELFVPNYFHIEIMCSIDAKEQAIKGKLYFDREELKKFISKNSASYTKRVCLFPPKISSFCQFIQQCFVCLFRLSVSFHSCM